jgi:hypothetical protein
VIGAPAGIDPEQISPWRPAYEIVPFETVARPSAVVAERLLHPRNRLFSRSTRRSIAASTDRLSVRRKLVASLDDGEARIGPESRFDELVDESRPVAGFGRDL